MDYTKYFTRKIRKHTGLDFVCLTDDAPQELSQLIQDIHFDHFDACFPSDWIYETTYEAFEDLSEDDIDHVTIGSDWSDRDLYSWLGESFAHGYVNKILELEGRQHDLYEIIAQAQYNAKYNIYHAVNDFITHMQERS